MHRKKIQSLNHFLRKNWSLHLSNLSASHVPRPPPGINCGENHLEIGESSPPQFTCSKIQKGINILERMPDIGDTKILPHTQKKMRSTFRLASIIWCPNRKYTSKCQFLWEHNDNPYGTWMHLGLSRFETTPAVIDTFLPQLFSSYRFSRTLPANSEPKKNRSWPVPEKHPDPCDSNQRFWSLQSLWKTGWSWPVPPERPRRSPPILSDLPWNTQLQAVHCLSSVTFKVMQQSKSRQNMWKNIIEFCVPGRPLPAPATDGVQPSWVPPNMAHGPKKTSVPANAKKGGKNTDTPQNGHGSSQLKWNMDNYDNYEEWPATLLVWRVLHVLLQIDGNGLTGPTLCWFWLLLVKSKPWLLVGRIKAGGIHL